MPFSVWTRKVYRSIFYKTSPSFYYRWKKARMRKFYRQFIKPETLCFDIGASVGLFSETFLELGAKVIAVEPVNESFKRLNERLGGYPHFCSIQAAVSSFAGTSQIRKTSLLDLSTLDEGFVKFNEEQFKTKWKDTEAVSLITLDEIIKNFGLPAFCKIDVECHEKEVLSGLTSRIPVISFEYLFPFKNKALDCLDRISELSPNTVYNYSLYEFFQLENREWLDKPSFVSCLKKLSQEQWTGDIFCKL